MKASKEAASTEEVEGQAVNQPNRDLLPQVRGGILRFRLCVAHDGLLYLVVSFVFASRDYALPESPWLVVPFVAPFHFKPTIPKANVSKSNKQKFLNTHGRLSRHLP